MNVRRRVLSAGFVAVLALPLVPGCSASHPAAPRGASSPVPPLAVPRLWVLQAGYEEQIRSLDPALARRILGPDSIVLGATAHHPLSAFAWPSYAWFASMVNSTGVYRDGNSAAWLRPLRTAEYDPEAWPATPLPERLDPVAAIRRFGALAHAHGWTVVITPNPNLTSVPGAACAARSGETISDAYVRCGIAAEAARAADVVETQAQGLQGDPVAYRSFVERTAEQARAANPRVRLIAGITTGHRSTAEQMFAAWNSVRDLVDGYYLSIGGNERLSVAMRFLRMLPGA